MTTTAEPTTAVADVPYDPIDVDVPEAPEKETKPGREPLDPITKHLWRFRRPERTALILPFVGHEVKLERWYGRVAALGDEVYTGTILAVATTTIGSAADLVILKTTAGQVWAISTAQVAYLALVEPPRKAARAPRRRAEAPTADPAPKTTRRRKAKESTDAAA